MSKEVNAVETQTTARAVGNDDAAEDGVRMALWTRRPVCGPRTTVIDRLSALQSAGEIAAYDITTWPDEIVISKDTRHAGIVDIHEQFRAWADDSDLSVSLPFDRRRVTSLVGRTEEVLTLPVACLAVYGEDLCGVYPCDVGEETWTITDYVDAYEAASEPPSLAELVTSTPE